MLLLSYLLLLLFMISFLKMMLNGLLKLWEHVVVVDHAEAQDKEHYSTRV